MKSEILVAEKDIVVETNHDTCETKRVKNKIEEENAKDGNKDMNDNDDKNKKKGGDKKECKDIEEKMKKSFENNLEVEVNMKNIKILNDKIRHQRNIIYQRHEFLYKMRSHRFKLKGLKNNSPKKFEDEILSEKEIIENVYSPSFSKIVEIEDMITTIEVRRSYHHNCNNNNGSYYYYYYQLLLLLLLLLLTSLLLILLLSL